MWVLGWVLLEPDLFCGFFGGVFAHWFSSCDHVHLSVALHLATTVVDASFGLLRSVTACWGEICSNRCSQSLFLRCSGVFLVRRQRLLVGPDLCLLVEARSARFGVCGGRFISEKQLLFLWFGGVWVWFCRVGFVRPRCRCFMAYVLSMLCFLYYFCFLQGFFGWYVLIRVPFNVRIGLCFCWVVMVHRHTWVPDSCPMVLRSFLNRLLNAI